MLYNQKVYFLNLFSKYSPTILTQKNCKVFFFLICTKSIPVCETFAAPCTRYAEKIHPFGHICKQKDFAQEKLFLEQTLLFKFTFSNLVLMRKTMSHIHKKLNYAVFSERRPVASTVFTIRYMYLMSSNVHVIKKSVPEYPFVNTATGWYALIKCYSA